MHRLLLTIGIPLTVVFVLLVALAQARPRDDTDLRDLLLPPEGCPAPCWQGVRPGVMRLNTAAGILEETDGLEPVERPFRYSGPVSSAAISVSLLAHPGIPSGNPVIEALRLKLPGITFGEIQLALGQPDRVMTYTTPQRGDMPFVAAYSRYSLYVLVDMPSCHLNQTTLWNTTRYVEIVVGNWLEYSSDYYLSSRELDVNRWAHQLRSVRHCDEYGFEWVETAAGSFSEPEAH